MSSILASSLSFKGLSSLASSTYRAVKEKSASHRSLLRLHRSYARIDMVVTSAARHVPHFVDARLQSATSLTRSPPLGIHLLIGRCRHSLIHTTRRTRSTIFAAPNVSANTAAKTHLIRQFAQKHTSDAFLWAATVERCSEEISALKATVQTRDETIIALHDRLAVLTPLPPSISNIAGIFYDGIAVASAIDFASMDSNVEHVVDEDAFDECSTLCVFPFRFPFSMIFTRRIKLLVS